LAVGEIVEDHDGLARLDRIAAPISVYHHRSVRSRVPGIAVCIPMPGPEAGFAIHSIHYESVAVDLRLKDKGIRIERGIAFLEQYGADIHSNHLCQL
jgi:hypothetical protein